MSGVARNQDTDYLRREQYATARNLAARAALHERFSHNPAPWQAWVFDRLALGIGEAALECGCGPGWLWVENLHRLPAGCRVTLVDISDGMLAEAQERLASQPDRFTFRQANVQSLPFEDASFDLVVANHMLYHVPNLDAALSEIHRVLRPGGRLVAATNGADHMRELHELGQALFPHVDHYLANPARAIANTFRLENGAERLAPWFEDVRCDLYDSWLEVTEAEPLLDYMLSMPGAETAITPAMRREALDRLTERLAADGPLHITKQTGVFLARRRSGL